MGNDNLKIKLKLEAESAGLDNLDRMAEGVADVGDALQQTGHNVQAFGQAFGAVDSFFDSINGAFAGLAHEAAEASSLVDAAWKRLGGTPHAQIKAELQELAAAYRTAAQSGTASFKDIQRAQEAYLAKVKEVRGESTVAANAVNAAWATLGGASQAQVNAELKKLAQAYRTVADSGTASARDVARAYEAYMQKAREVRGQVNAVSGALRDQGQASLNLGHRIKSLVGMYVGFQLVESTVRAAARALGEASRGAFHLESAVRSASREFGNTGALQDWQQHVRQISDHLKIYSEGSVKAAAAATLDMTKRLGLSAEQMRIVISRTGDLNKGQFSFVDAAGRVTAALRGEAEAAEMLGLTLNETYVKSWYDAQGATQGAWEKLTDLQKAQVRYAVFLEQTNAQVGEAARYAKDAAGAWQYLTARLSDAVSTNEELGAALRELATWVAENADELGEMAAEIASAVGWMMQFVVQNRELIMVLGGAGGLAFMALKAAQAFQAMRVAAMAAGGSQTIAGFTSVGSSAAAAGSQISGAVTSLSTFVATLNPLSVAISIGIASVGMFGEAFKVAQRNIDAAGKSLDQLRQYNEIAQENARKTRENFEKLREGVSGASDAMKVWNDHIAEIKATWKLQDLDVFNNQINKITDAYYKLQSAGASELQMKLFLESAAAAVQQLLDKVAVASPQIAAELKGMLPPELQQKVNALQNAFDGLGITSATMARQSAAEWIANYEAIAESAEVSAGDQQRALDALVDRMIDLAKDLPDVFKDAYASLPDIVKEAVNAGIQELDRLKQEKDTSSKNRNRGGSRGGWSGRSVSSDVRRTSISTTTLPPQRLGEKRTWIRSSGEINPSIDPDTMGAFSSGSSFNLNTDKARDAIAEVAEKADEAAESERTLRFKIVTEGNVNNIEGKVIPGFARGGEVFRRLASPHISQGSGLRDDVPAMLTRNEFVLTPSAVKKYGLDFLYALNSGRVPLDVIPRFASGGLVLPPQIVDLVPRFAKGGSVTRGSGTGWGLPFSSASDILQKYGARSIDELLARYASTIASTASRIRLPEITDTPAAYLSSALGVVADSLEVFRANDVDAPQKIASGDSATAALERQKLAISGEYENKIAIVRREGNESLAILLEQERLELVAVVQELQSAIEELVEAYRMEVEAVALEAEEEMRGLSDEFDAEYEEIWELSKKIGGGTGTGNVHQIHVHQTAAKKEAALRKRYERLLARVERSAGREITGQYRLLERDVKSEGRDATAQGVDSEATARLDLRATYGDFLTRIQELEIEKAQALRDLEEEYGTLSISGFKHWLATGGLVSGAVGGKAGIRKFAEGGHVPLNVGTPGKDSVPAWLMPGEFVLKERVVRTLGLPVLQAVNRMDASLLDSFKSVQKFASGGLVGGAAASLPSTSTGGDMEDFGTLTLNINGSPYEVRAKRATARALRNELTRMARSSR